MATTDMATRPTIGSIGDELGLRIRQGATFGPFRLPFVNADGTPMDLTGCTLRAQMRRHALDAEALADFECVIDNPVITDPATESQAYFGLDAATTAALPATENPSDPANQGVWDMELVDADGRVIPVFYGPTLTVREVTRA